MAQAMVRLCVSTASSFEQRVALCVSKQSALLRASPVDTRMYTILLHHDGCSCQGCFLLSCLQKPVRSHDAVKQENNANYPTKVVA